MKSLRSWWSVARHLPDTILILDQKIEGLRGPVKSYGDALGGFSRDLQIIRDQIKREWQRDPRVMDILDGMLELRGRIVELEERLSAPAIAPPETPDPEALSRIADALERAFPAPLPPRESRPSDLNDLRTVTSEDVDEKTRFWNALAERHGIAPGSDLFQAMILEYEQTVRSKLGETEIDWDQVFEEAKKQAAGD